MTIKSHRATISHLSDWQRARISNHQAVGQLLALTPTFPREPNSTERKRPASTADREAQPLPRAQPLSNVDNIYQNYILRVPWPGNSLLVIYPLISLVHMQRDKLVPGYSLQAMCDHKKLETSWTSLRDLFTLQSHSLRWNEHHAAGKSEEAGGVLAQSAPETHCYMGKASCTAKCGVHGLRLKGMERRFAFLLFLLTFKR